jgi:two-component system response regulator CpxR
MTDAKTRVLIIDDDKKLCRLLGDYLSPMGYEVRFAHDGAEGLAAAQAGGADVVILDVMLPGLDGFEVLRRLRAVSATPVLMLTARGEETDRVVGLEMGADDYLPKPFSTRELLARLRAITRRFVAAAQPAAVAAAVVSEGGLALDPGARSARLDGRDVELTTVEFDLLLALVESAGRVLTRDQLLERAAGRDYDAFDRSIDVHISALRRKLGDDPRKPRFIRTLRGAGYQFLRAGAETE